MLARTGARRRFGARLHASRAAAADRRGAGPPSRRKCAPILRLPRGARRQVSRSGCSRATRRRCRSRGS
jgi:hypothetical protein